MTLTISTSEWEQAGVTPQNKSIQSALNSKLSIYAVKVTFGSADNYSTNGVSADLKDPGRISTLVAVVPTYTDTGFVVQYDKANQKIKLYGEEQVSGETTPGAALNELANGSTLTQSKVFEFLVFGY